MDPGFRSYRLSCRFVFAIAHIRGSQIYGRPGKEDGKLLKKKTHLSDLMIVPEHR